jgi:L-asparaginase
LTTADLVNVGHELAEIARSGVDGIVVLHGTSTLEETAFFLELTWDADVGVVFTAAQRPPGLVASDALVNIEQAVRVAAEPGIGDGRVLVSFGGDLHDARWVVKVDTSAAAAFESWGGAVGRVLVDGQVRLDRPLPPRSPLCLPVVCDDLPRVDVAVSYLGSDGAAIAAFIDAGAKGIVSAGLLPGVVTPKELEALEDALDAGVVVVQSIRAGRGRARVPAMVRARGVIPAGDHPPSKARVLLAVGLAAGLDREELVDRFDRS